MPPASPAAAPPPARLGVSPNTSSNRLLGLSTFFLLLVLPEGEPDPSPLGRNESQMFEFDCFFFDFLACFVVAVEESGEKNFAAYAPTFLTASVLSAPIHHAATDASEESPPREAAEEATEVAVVRVDRRAVVSPW